MQNGGFVNKIQGVRLSVAKIHRHVFENPGCKVNVLMQMTRQKDMMEQLGDGSRVICSY